MNKYEGERVVRVYKRACVMAVLLVFADVFLNAVVESLMGNLFVFIMCIGLQGVERVLAAGVTLLQMWQTFPAKYGLLGILLKRFKVIAILMPASFIVSLIFRVYEMVAVILKWQQTTPFWDLAGMHFLYIAHSLVSLAYCVAVLHTCHELGKRDLYNPETFAA